MGFSAIDYEGELFSCFAFHAALVILKVLLMVPLTARQRFAKAVFSNAEDARVHPKGKVSLVDPDVERVRRAHLNDLENIPFFVLIGWFYLMTNPSLVIAKNMFRLFTVCRYLHTFVYAVVPLPQPARGIAFFGAFLVIVVMTVSVLLAAF
ncbi:unnamed protein product [Notodromas monacha]|uniref:Microsomal glutathione S-transferase 1 n=1 Tax=Notodromas monacha TaxID=399045 RepID=A0A7R9BQ78_9CRUS|nr:unnamed protein product [Notodromas monacha]CAG0919618.1 unnamed protein product [Notodromas monacha]